MLIKQHVLIVINALSLKEAELISQIIDLHGQTQINISLLYVTCEMPAVYYQLPSIVNLKSQMMFEMHNHLQEIREIFKLDRSKLWIKSGNLKTEAQMLARQLNVDIIISNSLANANFATALDPILSKKLWRLPGKISSGKFQDYLTNLTECALPRLLA